MPEKLPPETDRRASLRLHLDVLLSHRPVDVNQVATGAPEAMFDAGGALDLLSALRRIDQESVEQLKVLAERNRPLAEYLLRINRKIELVARECVTASAQAGNTVTVELADGGLTFSAERALYKDSHLAVRIVFLPSYAVLCAYATVLRCEEQGEKRFAVTVAFEGLAETDVQLIARERLRAESRQRRRQKSAGSPRA